MKISPAKRFVVPVVAVLAVGVLPVWADINTSVPLTQYRPDNSSYQLRASDLLGKTINNREGENIGEVDDLLVRRATQDIEAVLSIGGFLGFGDKLVSVPYDSLLISADGTELYYDASREALESLQEFEYENNEQWATPVTGTADGGIMDQLGLAKDDQGVDWNKLDHNFDAFKEAASERWSTLTAEDWDAIRANRRETIDVLSQRTGESKGELELELVEMIEAL